MIHRVPPKEGQPVAQTGFLRLGAPPLVNELDAQIKELNQKREQEKKELVDQAMREGALARLVPIIPGSDGVPPFIEINSPLH